MLPSIISRQPIKSRIKKLPKVLTKKLVVVKRQRPSEVKEVEVTAMTSKVTRSRFQWRQKEE